MKVISLSSNYRSHQSILDATFGMIEKNYNEGEYQNLRVPLRSESKDPQRPIEYILAGNMYSADIHLTNELKDIIKKSPDSKIAVIVRRNRDVEKVLSLCKIHNISACAERGIDIFSHPLVSIYFNLLQYLSDPTYPEGLATSLSVGLWNMNFEKSVLLLKKLRAGFFDEVIKEIPALSDLQKEIVHSGVISYLILVADLSGFSEKFRQSPESAEVWRAIINLARSLAESSHIYSPGLLIRELLAYKKSAETKSIKISNGDASAQVSIMTAHGSKGLEYDYVFLPYATEESWMHRFRTASFVLPREKDESDEIKDTRRLFYVAITRARKHAVILASQKDATGKDLLPLRFVDELESSHVIKKEIPAENEIISSLSLSSVQSDREKEIIDYTKRVILENGLSVTALNHFLECPSQFFYKSILKIPEAPNAISEKGIAMHKALSLIWKENNKSVESIQNNIKKTAVEYFKISLLSAFDKEIVLEELLESTPKVASALKDYFNLIGKISTEKWVEMSLSHIFEGVNIDFNIHGQLDVIIENENKVDVFDYKTKEGMSLNAIKGETQGEDGNYFRQLVFYKMLLEKNSNFRDKEIVPSLIFVKPDSKGRCPTVTVPISENDTQKVMDEIRMLIDSVWSGNFLTNNCNDPKCKWCAMKKNK